MNPRHPVYIVSKGRSDRCMTSAALQAMGVPHRVVVEAQEADLYRARLGPLAEVLILDPRYQEEYDACDDLGMTKGKGPGPARNFAWEHSVSRGASWHWVMDDNIRKFYRFHRNLTIPVADGTILRCMEDFVERCSNVAMAGPNYYMFVARKTGDTPPFVPNTRIYSCNLILNGLPYRWRARYNEDTDLSLRILKDHRATIQFNAFLQHKTPTQLMKGGNTDEFYAKEGTLPKSAMLARMHPDVVELVWKFGRAHHKVDDRPFRRNVLGLRPAPPGADEYGMSFERLEEGEWTPKAGPVPPELEPAT